MFHILKGFSCTYITYNISICFKDNKITTEEQTFKPQNNKWTSNVTRRLSF